MSGDCFDFTTYGRGNSFQPDESPLELTRAHVFESSCPGGATLKVMAIPDFTITPRGAAIATFGAARPVRRNYCGRNR